MAACLRSVGLSNQAKIKQLAKYSTCMADACPFILSYCDISEGAVCCVEEYVQFRCSAILMSRRVNGEHVNSKRCMGVCAVGTGPFQ